MGSCGRRGQSGQGKFPLLTVYIEVWRPAHRRGCYSSTWRRHPHIDPSPETRVTAPCEGDGDGGAGHPSTRRHIVKVEATRNEGKSRLDAPHAAITRASSPGEPRKHVGLTPKRDLNSEANIYPCISLTLSLLWSPARSTFMGRREVTLRPR